MLMESENASLAVPTKRNWVKRALKVEWLGQTADSIFWIASVFSYGVSSTGDWLQLCAASAWFVANIASITTPETD